MNTIKKLMIASFAFGITALFLIGCDQNSQDNSQADESIPTENVQIMKVKPQRLKIINQLSGRVEPLRIAEVRARVEGIIIKRNFEEGSLVKEGQILFEIDPKPLQYALSRAEAELTRNKATLDELEIRVNRYQSLLKTKAVSQQDYDMILSSYKNTQGAYKSAQADVEMAKLNLGYASITAPISGRIGRSLVTEGALVSNNQTTSLAVIQQIDPIYVDIKQPINEILTLREQFSQFSQRFTRDQTDSQPLTLTIDGSKVQLIGKLLFSDITVERSTGQVLLRGLFDNADELLFPGMFVRVNVEQYIDHQAILIPQRAVQIRVDGQAEVLTVNSNHIVEAKMVQTGKMYGANWYIIDGLNDGDSVIVGGSAQPGSLVSTTQVSSVNLPATADQDDSLNHNIDKSH